MFYLPSCSTEFNPGDEYCRRINHKCQKDDFSNLPYVFVVKKKNDTLAEALYSKGT